MLVSRVVATMGFHISEPPTVQSLALINWRSVVVPARSTTRQRQSLPGFWYWIRCGLRSPTHKRSFLHFRIPLIGPSSSVMTIPRLAALRSVNLDEHQQCLVVTLLCEMRSARLALTTGDTG